MKNLFFSIAVIAVCAVSCAPKNEAGLKGWDLQWQEEFNGHQLDSTVWSMPPVEGMTGWHYGCVADERTWSLEDGIFTIKGIKTDDEEYGVRGYITTSALTFGKKAFPLAVEGQRSRMDVRARMSKAAGWQPSIWMTEPTGYPEFAEIDVMEQINFEDRVYQTIHTQQSIQDPRRPNAKFVAIDLDPTEWHVYSVVVDCEKLVYMIDGEVTMEYSAEEFPDEYPFPGHSYCLHLQSIFGTGWTNNEYRGDGPRPVPNGEGVPCFVSYDWCRFYTQPIK